MPKNLPNSQRVEIEEVCIPRALLDYAPNLSGLSALWRPGRAAINTFPQETARAPSAIPLFTPFTRPDLSKKPWVPIEPGQERDVASWGNKIEGLKSTKPLNMQRFLYYRLRSLFAGDLERDCDKFGRLTGKIDLLGVVLHLAIAEPPFLAMEYDRVIRSRLASMDRERYRDCDKIDFSALLSTEQTEVTRQVVASPNSFLRARAPFPQRPGGDEFPRGGGTRQNNPCDSVPSISSAVFPKEGHPP